MEKVKFKFESLTNDGHAICERCGKAIHSTHGQSYWFHCHSMNTYCDELEAIPKAGSGYGDMTDKEV